MVILREVVVPHVEADILVVHVNRPIRGVVEIAYVQVHINTHVLVQDMLAVREQHVAENILLVPVLTYMLGMEVLVSIHTIICVQVDIALLIQVCILIVQLQRHVLAELLAELVIRIPIPAIVTAVQVDIVHLTLECILIVRPQKYVHVVR